MKKKAVKTKPRATAVTELPKPERWSYSSWATYNECGARFMYRYLMKMPEPPSPAMARGTDIHAKAEQFVKGNIRGLPPSLNKFAPAFAALKNMKPAVEEWWGVDEAWAPKTRGSWLVAKVDVSVVEKKVSTVIDHKTGKMYPDKHVKQASLYTAMDAALHPGRDLYRAEFWYLDLGEVLTWEWTPKETVKLQKEWTERGQAVMRADRLHPSPGYYCKWCPYASGVGGPCKAF